MYWKLKYTPAEKVRIAVEGGCLEEDEIRGALLLFSIFGFPYFLLKFFFMVTGIN